MVFTSTCFQQQYGFSVLVFSQHMLSSIMSDRNNPNDNGCNVLCQCVVFLYKFFFFIKFRLRLRFDICAEDQFLSVCVFFCVMMIMRHIF